MERQAPQFSTALFARFLFRVVVARDVVEFVRVFLEWGETQHGFVIFCKDSANRAQKQTAISPNFSLSF